VKILQVCEEYNINTVISELTELLAEHESVKSIEVLTFTEKWYDNGRSELIHGVNVSFSPLLSFIADFKLKSKYADIVHIHLPCKLATIACIRANIQCRLVISWHNDPKGITPKKLSQELLEIYDKTVQKAKNYIDEHCLHRLLRRADAIVIAYEDIAENSQYLGRYKKKTRVIAYGLDALLYDDEILSLNDPEKAENSVQGAKLVLLETWQENQKKVFTNAENVALKDLEVLVKSFKHLQGCELFIAGTAENIKKDLLLKMADWEAEKSVHELPITSRIHFIESKKAVAECEVYASRAGGVPQIEAMLYGKPVVSIGYSGFNIHGQTGMVCNENEVANVLQVLINDDDLRAKLGETAYNTARDEYTSDKMCEKFCELYSSFISIQT
jgi:rhamnosyl/mannosyltransferase